MQGQRVVHRLGPAIEVVSSLKKRIWDHHRMLDQEENLNIRWIGVTSFYRLRNGRSEWPLLPLVSSAWSDYFEEGPRPAICDSSLRICHHGTMGIPPPTFNPHPLLSIEFPH